MNKTNYGPDFTNKNKHTMKNMTVKIEVFFKKKNSENSKGIVEKF